MKKMLKVVVFTIKGQMYGASVHQVQSIESVQALVELPQSSAFLKGVIDLRGYTVPIIDLNRRLNMIETTVTDKTRVLIANIEEGQVGFMVDSATDVIDIDPSEVAQTPIMLNNDNGKYLQGVINVESELLLLLDLNHVLNDEHICELSNAISS